MRTRSSSTGPRPRRVLTRRTALNRLAALVLAAPLFCGATEYRPVPETETGCLDVVGADVFYDAAYAIVTASIHLAAPSCRKAAYGLRVYTEGGAGDLGVVQRFGDGKSDALHLEVRFAPQDRGLCSLVGFELTTVARDGAVVDRAPDPRQPGGIDYRDDNGNGIQDDAELCSGALPTGETYT